jgi:A/G-specific adenine glycosylase
MLQQTQTERVMNKYGPFLRRFPDYRSLAAASTARLLDAWQGLGYNRRALAMRRIAEKVLKDGGRLPSDTEALLALPMIGPATAGSLRAFVFNLPSVFIETNIRRVFIHCVFPDAERVTDREILSLIEKTLDRRNPRHWYYALMDYGVYLKGKVSNPNRRSSGYRLQPAFEGSKRQLRGRILRLLLTEEHRGYEQLLSTSNGGAERLDACLDELEREGFIVREAAGYRLKG